MHLAFDIVLGAIVALIMLVLIARLLVRKYFPPSASP